MPAFFIQEDKTTTTIDKNAPIHSYEADEQSLRIRCKINGRKDVAIKATEVLCLRKGLPKTAKLK